MPICPGLTLQLEQELPLTPRAEKAAHAETPSAHRVEGERVVPPECMSDRIFISSHSPLSNVSLMALSVSWQSKLRQIAFHCWSVGPSRKGATQSAHSRFGKAMARTRARHGPNGICPATRSRVCPYIIAPAVSDSQSEGQPEKSSPPVAGPSSSMSCSGCEVLSM